MVILCRSKRSAERVMSSIIGFIEEKMFLKVNKGKSQTKGADIPQQWLGQRPQEAGPPPIHCWLDKLLQAGRHEKPAAKDRHVVQEADQDGNMETMETDKNQTGEPYQVR